MLPIWFVLVSLVVLSVALYLVESLLPLPPVPKRIGEAVLVLAFLYVVAHRMHWLGV